MEEQLAIKEIIKYIGDKNCICILAKANNDKYYIFAAKTEKLGIEMNSMSQFINNRYFLFDENNRRLYLDIIPRENGTIYHLIAIKNPEFFEDAVKIIQAFI